MTFIFPSVLFRKFQQRTQNVSGVAVVWGAGKQSIYSARSHGTLLKRTPPHPRPLLSEGMLDLFTQLKLLPLKMTPQPASLIPKTYRSLFVLNDLIDNISDVRRKKKRTKRGVCNSVCVCVHMCMTVCVCVCICLWICVCSCPSVCDNVCL